ncbi:MAG TPA: hypothetical protein VHI52_17290, partial [Verrucomicrobiae bacterium]|nr:hypothetical protein [Verrucomicrobiae bacterium]
MNCFDKIDETSAGGPGGIASPRGVASPPLRNPLEPHLKGTNVRTTVPFAQGVNVLGPTHGRQAEILSPEALAFLAALHREFNPRRQELLRRRAVRQERVDAGEMPGFPEETRAVREGSWQVLPVPEDLQDRRVEITGPVDRKMVINALNSGASCYMADFEDAHSPTWEGTLDGQINLRDAVRKTIEYLSPEGKKYRLNQQPATLLVRPRGWHLDEKHIRIDNEPISGSLFDFGLYFFHNARCRVIH